GLFGQAWVPFPSKDHLQQITEVMTPCWSSVPGAVPATVECPCYSGKSTAPETSP
ncbi:hypothetical protein P7K49_002832, partial [Saguinus oedipus]